MLRKKGKGRKTHTVVELNLGNRKFYYERGRTKNKVFLKPLEYLGDSTLTWREVGNGGLRRPKNSRAKDRLNLYQRKKNGKYKGEAKS